MKNWRGARSCWYRERGVGWGGVGVYAKEERKRYGGRWSVGGMLVDNPNDSFYVRCGGRVSL